MRHQVYPAHQPDALYAIWDGQPFQAQTSTSDGTVLLIATAGQEPPDGFDRDYEGAPARVVPSAEVPDSFVIHSTCRYADEVFVLAAQAPTGELTLQWTGTDEATARRLGLMSDTSSGETTFGTIARPEHIETLWQERLDFSERTGPVEGKIEAPRLLRGIGRVLRGMRPDGAGAVAAQFRQVGGYSELEVRTGLDGVTFSLAAPPALGQLFTELRASMYQPGQGSWFTGTFSLTPDDKFDFDYDASSQPQWRRAPDEDGRPTARAFAHELARFPREPDQVPPWLAAHAGLPLDVQLRHAQVVDVHTPGQQPVVNRPPVPPQEVRGVLHYLYSSPVVLVGENPPGPRPDIFAPQTAPSVPNAFHTDGRWIWPASVPHYLRMHGVAPEPELLESIREKSYRPPFVGQKLRETARADLLGEPYPPQSPADLDEHDAVTEVERDDSSRPVLSASQVLVLLEKRLGELGISPQVYRIGEIADDAWCLYHQPWDEEQPPGWEVALHTGGRVLREQRFADVSAAAAYLLGMLAFHPTRSLAGPDPAEQPTDWPVLPPRGEPPLTLLRGKRLVVLPPGTELVRFGGDGGNLTHAASSTFREAALLPDREQQRAFYRVARPLRVLTGVALPFGGMPGGALAYLLPRAIGHHVETGALEKIDAPESDTTGVSALQEHVSAPQEPGT
ncbi:MAG: glycohydrolase toxin TNT-related protein [Thermocrispum sp.]